MSPTSYQSSPNVGTAVLLTGEPSLSQSGRDSARFNNFDFLRFALASLVIFSHSFDLLNGRETNPVLLFTRGQSELGSVAVDGFFVLSGFLITMSFLNSRSLADYLRRRVLRIYPGYMVAALLALVVFGPLGMYFARSYWNSAEPGTFLVRLPFLRTLWVPQTFTHNHWPYVNSPIWTIQHEFVCYLLVAVLGITGLLRRRAVVLGIFVPIYVFFLIQMPMKLWIYNWQELPVGGAPDNYPRFWTYFLVGSLAFLYRDRIRYDLRAAIGCLAVVLVAARVGWGMDAVMPFALAYILFSVGFSNNIPLQRWANRGDFSYGLYLYGWPVQQSLIFLGQSWISPWPLFALALPISFLFASGSWYFVERPFLWLKGKK